MSEYAVFEEPAANHAEFGCQTEEISLGEAGTQTVEESISEYHHKNDDENPELAYWEAIIANRKSEVHRMKKINEKMEEEKTEKMTLLETKQAEYKRLFELGNDKLNRSKEEEEEIEGEEEDEHDDDDDEEKEE